MSYQEVYEEMLDDYEFKQNTKEEFLTFMDVLISSYEKEQQTWENRSLGDFLGALQSWVEDMEQYYINTDQPVPQNIPWNVIADILMAAKIYE